jgi:L-asparaginase
VTPGAPAQAAAHRTVRVLTTGGTIASRATAGGAVASDGPAELLAGLEADGVRCIGEEVIRLGSYRFGDDELRAVVRAALAAAAAPGADGVVVTHGTDTMEETAFLADVVYDGAAPIVFCGSQRDGSQPDGDGPRNLADAVRVAADPAAAGLGALICMAGRAWPGRYAVKAHSTHLDAFRAPEAGPVASVSDGAVRVLAAPRRAPAFAPELLARALPRADIVPAYIGADGALIRAARAAGARGIVVAAFGSGNVTPAMAEAIGQAVAAGVPVLISSRCAAGPTLPHYGGPGGSASLAAAGAIFGGGLRASHARIVLSLALAVCSEPERIAEFVGPFT